MDFKGPDKFGLGEEVDFSVSWETADPFLHAKSSMYEKILRNHDMHNDYPYDAILNQIIAGGLIRHAHKLDSLVEIRYGWEPLDNENIVLHSCIGYVMHPLIFINGNKPGFLMEMEEDGQVEPVICSYEYSKVFWLAPIR